MTRTIHTLCAAALLLAATACEDTLQTAAPTPGNGPTLTLRIDNEEEGAQTRTDLANADPTNNVQSVRILIFRGGTEADNYNDATYVGEETISEEEWPEETTRYEYTLKSAFVDGQTYTLLGVGMDDTFSDTYAIDQNETLDETYARLKEGKTPARCEFFTGTVSFTQAGKNTQIDDLHLRRRVAGAMLYVNEIPQELTESSDNSTYRVTSARLVLGTPQKSSVLLKRDFAKKDWQEPDGQTQMSDDSKTLATIDFENNLTYTPGKDFYMDSETGKPATGYAGFYLLPLNKTEDTHTFTVQLWGKKDNLDGTFGEETPLSKQFIVENRSESNATAFDIRSNYIYCIGKLSPEQGIDAPISLSGEALYVEVQKWQKVETGHDFGPARVQAVFDDKENERQNCMSHWYTINLLPPAEMIQPSVTEITVTVDDKEIPDDVTDEYDRRCNYHWLFLRTTTDKADDTEATKLADSYQKSLTLYTRQGDEESFAGPITLPKIEVFMEDYARPRTSGYGWEPDATNGGYKASELNEKITKNITEDVRRMNLILSTSIDYNGVKTTRTDTMTIEQYNTITVAYTKEIDNTPYTAFCGFNREDLVNQEPGLISDEYLFEWGYGSDLQYNTAIYDEGGIGSNKYATGSTEDGGWNVQYITIQATWKDDWLDTAPNKAQYVCYEMGETLEPTGGYRIQETTNIREYGVSNDEGKFTPGWYLPAELEMEGLMMLTAACSNIGYKEDDYNHRNEVTNIQYNSRWYWTSTTDGHAAEGERFSIIGYQYTYSKENDEYTYLRQPWSRREQNRCYIRQARHFAEDMPGWPTGQ